MWIQDWRFILIILGLALVLIWLFFGSSTAEPIIGLQTEERSMLRKMFSPLSQSTMKIPLSTTQPNVSTINQTGINGSTVTRFNIKFDNPLPVPKIRVNNRPSKGELKCKQVLEELFAREFVTVRPDFLCNPETGYNLELDCYNHDLRLAVEYNGEYHYKQPKNHTLESFEKRQYLDQLKAELCERNGIHLITVPYTVSIDEIEGYIMERLPPVLKELI